MRYRKLDVNGDYSFGHSADDFYQDQPEAVGQAVQTRLLLWIGEWFLDTEEGTNYLQGILGKTDQSTADMNIQARISGTQGFDSIESFSSTQDPDSRAYSFTANINTIYGPTLIQRENYATY